MARTIPQQSAEAVASAGFPREAVLACLARVGSSRPLARSQRLRSFLRYAVGAVLDGRTEELKERTIATEVYGRSLVYDPRCDPIVRSEAHRLRAKLAAYYAHEGCGDPIVIELPKGSYQPFFRANDAEATARARVCRLAVTCFEENDGKGGKSGFGLAMAEAVAKRLTGRPGLQLVNRRSGTQGGRRPRPVDADYAVDGAFERAGRGCRLTARVVRVGDDEEIWRDSYRFPWKRVAEIQDEVADRVSASIGAFLARAGEGAQPADPRAYELLVKAHYSVLQYANTSYPEYLEPARRRLLRVIELEPRNADALAELAFLHILQLYPPQGDPGEHTSRAQALLQRALAAAPRHARALGLLGQIHALRGRGRAALDVTETAVAVDPDDAEARSFLAIRHLSLGFEEAAVRDCEHALGLDPVWYFPQYVRASCLARLGRFAAAHEVVDAVCREDPGTPHNDFIRACVCIVEGDLERCEATLERNRLGSSPLQDASHLEIASGLVAALRGEEAEARRVLEKHRDSPLRFQDHLLRLSLALGDVDLALAHLAPGAIHRNYRWLAGEPLARRFLRVPRLRNLLEELHGQWLRDLEEVGPRLAAPPRLLPLPEALLASATDSPNPS